MNSSTKSKPWSSGSIINVDIVPKQGRKYLLSEALHEHQTQSSRQLSPSIYSCSPSIKRIRIVPCIEPPERLNVVLPKKKKKKKCIQQSHQGKEEEIQNIEAEVDGGEKENSEEFNDSLFLPYGRRKKRKRKRKKKGNDLELPFSGDVYDGLTPNIQDSRKIITADANIEPEKVQLNMQQEQEKRQSLYHETKDAKGKNKSTKHTSTNATHCTTKSVKDTQVDPSCRTKKVSVVQIVSDTSSQNTSESLSGSDPKTILLSSDTPPSDHIEAQSIISEQSIGIQTQAIFKNKEYQGNTEPSSPEVFVYCSDSESDEPEVLYKSKNKVKKQNAENKRTTKKKSFEPEPLNILNRLISEPNIITVNTDGGSSPEEPHLPPPLDQRTIRKDRESIPKITCTPNLKSQSQPPFPEISPCSEAEMSPHLPSSQGSAFMTPRNTSRLTKLSLSQRKRMSDDALSQDTNSPDHSSRKSKINRRFGQQVSKRLNITHSIESAESEFTNKKTKVKFHEDNDPVVDLPKLTFNDGSVSSLSLLGTLPESKYKNTPVTDPNVISSSVTFIPVQTSTQMLEERVHVQNTYKQSKFCKKHPPNIIPETSESSVSSSEQASSSLGTDVQHNDENKNSNVSSANVKLKSPTIAIPVSASSPEDQDIKVDSTNTEEDSQLKLSSGSSELSKVSENPSTDSSASTEMLRPVGKTCLQSIAYVLQTHFGGTLTESFNVLQRNNFNLLTSIMELQALHPELEEALFGDEEEEQVSE